MVSTCLAGNSVLVRHIDLISIEKTLPYGRVFYFINSLTYLFSIFTSIILTSVTGLS